MKKILLLLLLLSGFFQACGVSESARPTQTASPRPSATLTHTPTFTATSTLTPTVTATPTLTFTPTPTPFAGGGRIAFWAWDLSSDSLYTINPDGTDLRLVFNAVDNGYQGRVGAGGQWWSPSGRYLLFTLWHDRMADYYIYDALSDEVTFLIQDSHYPLCAWQPDEEAIVCSMVGMPSSSEVGIAGLYRQRLEPNAEPELIFPWDPSCESAQIWGATEDNQYLLYINGWNSAGRLTRLVLVDENCQVVDTLYEEAFNQNIGLGMETMARLVEDPHLFIAVDGSRNHNKTILYSYSFTDHTRDLIFELDTYTRGYQLSPDGEMIAMANATVSQSGIRIEISRSVFRLISFDDQEILYEDQQNVGNQFCWSRDGRYLFVGGKQFGVTNGVYSFSPFAVRLELSSGVTEDIFTQAGILLSETRTEFSCSP